MKIEGEEVPTGSVRDADVCIIGSGAAGIAIARELIPSKLNVILLEAGAQQWTESSQDAYAANSVTTIPENALDREFPQWSRLRYFGGSTNHWGGWCRPFEEQDFARRPWIPLSGWPISRSDLIPYYDKAANYVQMKPFDLNEEATRPNTLGVTTREFHYSPPTRFAEVYGPELFAAKNIEVILNASAVRFDTNDSGTVENVVVKNKKTEFAVRARFFILACGGIENARLLLHSDHQQSGGLANSSDMVGRCFMEHPHATIGLVMNVESPNWHQAFTGTRGTDPMRVFTTTRDFQNQFSLLNYSCEMQVRKSAPIDPSEAIGLTDFIYGKSQPVDYLTLYTRSEMLPNPENRVSLTEERDAWGVRRIDLNINFSRDDLRSVVKSTEAVIRSLSHQALGRGRISLVNDDLWSTDLGPGCHHMGTTRMADNPREGVVDRNSKAHDLNNLYIAGSSVFATASYANPTLTIVAMALRLTDHIRTKGGDT